MDIQKLTKKNQEFIHIATNQLIKDGKSDQEIKDILGNVIPELIENQKKGITGRGLLGAPTVWAASFSPEKHQKPETGKPNKEVPETSSSWQSSGHPALLSTLSGKNGSNIEPLLFPKLQN